MQIAAPIQHRYVLLDGVRGVAAMAVFLHHTGSYWHLPKFHANLAVDLFFVLSGFVIGHAYDRKLRDGTLTRWQFFGLRVARLYPMYLAAIGFAMAVYLLRFITHLGEYYTLGAVFPVLLLSLLGLPSKFRDVGLLYYFNAAFWSLLFEVFANLIYVWVRPWLNLRVHLGIIVVGAAGLIFCATQNWLGAGFTWDVASFVAGSSRALFGFFAGLLIFRHQNLFVGFKTGGKMEYAAFVLPIALIFVPGIGVWTDVLIDLPAILLVMPVAVLVLARNSISAFAQLWLWLGALSYPLYVLHFPVALLVTSLNGGREDVLAPASGILLFALLAWLTNYLTVHWEKPLQRRIKQAFGLVQDDKMARVQV